MAEATPSSSDARVMGAPSTSAPDGDPMLASTAPLHLRVGVTGHRNLSPTPGLVKVIRSVLDRIQADLRHTPLTMEVVSALAEGADRIVAAEALKDGSSTLLAVLPMPVEDYARDFKVPESLQAFEAFLGRAGRTELINTGPIDTQEAREAAYGATGRFIIETSDVLIAVWDGEPPRGEGGTGAVVKAARDRKVPLIWILSKEPFTVQWEGTRAWDGFREIDRFNRPPLRRASVRRELTDQRARLLVDAQKAGLSTDGVASVLQWGLPRLVRADKLARSYRWAYVLISDCLFGLAALAVSVIAFQGFFFPELQELALIEVVAIAASLALWVVGRRFAVHDRWLRYRALAERLRSAIFLALIDPPPTAVPRPLSLRGDAAKREWPARAFAEVSSIQPVPPTSPEEGLRCFLSTAWIGDQIRYFDHRARTHGRQDLLVLSSLAGLLLLTLLVATIHAFKLFPGEAPQWVERLWTFLSILFPGLAGAIGGVAAMREHRRTRDRFLQVKEGLNRIQERLRAPGTETTISIAKEAHSLLLGENLAWFDVLRYHELEPA